MSLGKQSKRKSETNWENIEKIVRKKSTAVSLSENNLAERRF